MLIDCDTCVVRGPACADCVVTVLLGAPPVRGSAPEGPALDLDQAEQAAIAVLAGSGLVPPLRLVPVEPGDDAGNGEDGGDGAASGRRCAGGGRRAAEAG